MFFVILQISQILYREILLMDNLIRKTSVLTIIKQEGIFFLSAIDIVLFDEFKSCLEVIVIDNQIECIPLELSNK